MYACLLRATVPGWGLQPNASQARPKNLEGRDIAFGKEAFALWSTEVHLVFPPSFGLFPTQARPLDVIALSKPFTSILHCETG